MPNPTRMLVRRILAAAKSRFLMGIVYFKRFRMEVDLAEPLFPQPVLPANYRLTPWDDRLLEAHAEVKFRCFRGEMDANVFPSLGERDPAAAG